jgi:hypothetical protein
MEGRAPSLVNGGAFSSMLWRFIYVGPYLIHFKECCSSIPLDEYILKIYLHILLLMDK